MHMQLEEQIDFIWLNSSSVNVWKKKSVMIFKPLSSISNELCS